MLSTLNGATSVRERPQVPELRSPLPHGRGSDKKGRGSDKTGRGADRTGSASDRKDSGKARKSGRGLGDWGECARCRNGDLQARRLNPETWFRVAVETSKKSVSSGPFGLLALTWL